jgi:predicted nucleic acid-binding protein
LKTGKGLLPAGYEKFTLHLLASTYTTLLASETFKDSGLEQEVMDFAKKYFTVSDVNEAVALKAAQLVREHDMVLADALLAAFALVNGVALLTNDQKPFKSVEGLMFAEV